jgi:hypothetical protein
MPREKILPTVLIQPVRRKLEKQANVVIFRLVADELLEKMRREGRAAATLTKTSWLLEFALSDIGDAHQQNQRAGTAHAPACGRGPR